MATIPPNGNQEPLIFEMVEKSSNVNDFVLVPVTGARAFRRYNALLGPATNRAGNLRGMVVNAKMHWAFKLAGEVGGKLAVISALIEVSKEYSRSKKVLASNDSGWDKGFHVATLVTAAVARSFTSVVPTAFHLGAMSLEGYAMLLSEINGSNRGNDFATKLDAVDKKITEVHSRQWDGEVWYRVVTGTVQ